VFFVSTPSNLDVDSMMFRQEVALSEVT